MNAISDALLTLRGVQLYRSFLRRSQYFNEEQIRAQQTSWLARILQHAHANIPWYSSRFREHGVNPFGSDPFAELAKLPILTKAEVRENHADFCVSGAAATSVAFTTSGTTGEPLQAYTSKNQWIFEQGVIWRQWAWAGYRFRDKMAVFRSYAPAPGEPLMRTDRLRNWTYFSVFRMDDAALDEYFRFLESWKPRFLRGYPSSLMLVAQHALRRGIRIPSLKAAFVASEAVPEGLRQALRDAFGIELFDHYGQAEITAMLHDCERHEGLHVDWEYGFVELVPAESSDTRRLVATNLHNLSMPLLRYDTGDLVVGGWGRCSCGRGAPTLAPIIGRKDDYLIGADGSRMSTVRLYTYFSKLKEIRRFQLRQDQPGKLTVAVAAWDGEPREAATTLRRKIEHDLSELTGLTVHVPEDPEFVQAREGKFPVFIQRIAK